MGWRSSDSCWSHPGIQALPGDLKNKGFGLVFFWRGWERFWKVRGGLFYILFSMAFYLFYRGNKTNKHLLWIITLFTIRKIWWTIYTVNIEGPLYHRFFSYFTSFTSVPDKRLGQEVMVRGQVTIQQSSIEKRIKSAPACLAGAPLFFWAANMSYVDHSNEEDQRRSLTLHSLMKICWWITISVARDSSAKKNLLS